MTLERYTQVKSSGEMAKFQSIFVTEVYLQFDYIIIGAGSAGNVLATRLTEEMRDTTVLLLEAGGPDYRFDFASTCARAGVSATGQTLQLGL
ncbi:hypothetical protein ACNKHM_05765 [Shigella sonnei]